MAEDYVKNTSPHIKEGLGAKIEKVKGHLIEGKKARHDRNWSSALNEFNAMIEDGVDISQTVIKLVEITKGIMFRFNPFFSDFISVIISIKICLIAGAGI